MILEVHPGLDGFYAGFCPLTIRPNIQFIFIYFFVAVAYIQEYNLYIKGFNL